jgi:hypothetical protein
LAVLEAGLTNSTYVVETLARDRVYYWTIIPFDGDNIGSCTSGIWSFNVTKATTQNHAPIIDSKPITIGYFDEGYEYQVIAHDEDQGDVISYTLLTRPSGMVIDSSTGLIVWNPSETHLGNHKVTVRVSDGSIHVDQEFTIEIKSLSEKNDPPQIFGSPTLEAQVGKRYEYKIGAFDPDSDSLTFSIEKGPDGLKIDPSSGLITWTPKEDQEGENEISVRIHDGTYDVYQNYTVSVKGAEETSFLDSMLPYILLLILVIIIVVIAVVAARRRPREDKDEEPDEAAQEGPPSSEVDQTQQTDLYASSGEAHVGPAYETPVTPPPAVEEAVEDFKISEVFLIYNDGRLIAHSSIEEEEGVDRQLMSGMLIAIQGFVKESFQASSGLDSFTFGNRKVMLAGGKYLILAAVLTGVEPPMLRDELHTLVTNLEGLYAGVIESWDGSDRYFDGVNRYFLPIFKLRSKLKIKKKKRNVRMKSGIEFYSGYVRLKVGVSNEMEDSIGDINLNLDFDPNTLRLSHIEPEYPKSDNTVYLPDIYAGEKRTVAFYFDPIICQESHIDGWVSYTDQGGNQLEAKMKRRPVDIVCPIFYTKETVNVAMLKRLLKNLSFDDSRVYLVTGSGQLQQAYELAVATVKAHDVKFVRQFSEEEPYTAESWFYGEVDEAEEQLVIRVSVNAEKDTVEIFVSSDNLASMTGLLAELGSNFRKRCDESSIEREELLLQADEATKEAIKKTRLLLDKYAEAEVEADESTPPE